MNQWIIPQTVDLLRGECAGDKAQAIRPLAYPGNANAHKWRVTILNNKEAVSLTGYSASAYFHLLNGNNVLASGPNYVSISENVVSITFPDDVYALKGLVKGIMNLTKSGEASLTVAAIAFEVQENYTNNIIDPGSVIPVSLDALLAEINDMEEATAAALAAAANIATVEPNATAEAAHKVGEYIIHSDALYKVIADIDEDDALTVGGNIVAAPAGLGGEIVDVRQAVEDITGNAEIVNWSGKGKYINTSGSTADITSPASSTNYRYVVVPAAGGDVFTVTATGGSLGRAYAFVAGSGYSTPNAVLEKSTGTAVLNETVLVAPANSAYLVINDNTGTGRAYRGTLAKKRIADNADAIDANAAKIAETRADIYSVGSVIARSDLSTGKYYTMSNNSAPSTTDNANSLYTATPIDLSAHIGGKLTIVMNKISTFGTRMFGFLDADGKAHTGAMWNQAAATSDFVQGTDGLYRLELAIGYPKFVFSCNTDVSTVSIDIADTLKVVTADKLTAYYVSPSGSDSSDGRSAATPKLTINAALKAGAQRIMMAGGSYEQGVDLAYATHSTVELCALEPASQPVIYAPNSLIATSETQHQAAGTGTKAIYKTDCTKSFTSNNVWIFQDGVVEASTLIDGTTRHALQRGREYRCEDTRIIKCSASTLSDALTEIAGADDYRWFIDTENSKLYYSRPSAVSSSNPLRGCFNGSNNGLFANAGRHLSIRMTGIKTKYCAINLNNTSGSVASDCTAENVYYNGGITWDSACGVRLYRCEAQHIFNGTAGDGFNAHSGSTGDAFAKNTACIMFDCWAHDNQDDGYSDHERCEITLYGGLYEYNANGGGATPSLGAHCTCYNVTSRYNGMGGFRIADTASSADGGIGTQMDCYGCVSDSNGTSAQSGGYIEPNTGATVNDRFIAVNCVAMNEVRAFTARGNGVMTLIDCRTVNCTDVKTGSGTITTITGTPVDNLRQNSDGTYTMMG